jgi:hypothetical protein
MERLGADPQQFSASSLKGAVQDLFDRRALMFVSLLAAGGPEAAEQKEHDLQKAAESTMADRDYSGLAATASRLASMAERRAVLEAEAAAPRTNAHANSLGMLTDAVEDKAMSTSREGRPHERIAAALRAEAARVAPASDRYAETGKVADISPEVDLTALAAHYESRGQQDQGDGFVMI